MVSVTPPVLASHARRSGRSNLRPLFVGLTGMFGSGKTTVARRFRQRGAGVVNADRLAHEAFRKGSGVRAEIRKIFPELKGGLDRRRVARLVFKDAARRRKLEKVIHPYVFQRIREEVRRSKKRIVVVEVPLLFESGLDRRMDCNLVVKARPEVIARRLQKRGFSPGEVRARWKAQMPAAEKLRRADNWIDNSDGRAATNRQVNQLWKELKTSMNERSLTSHGKRKD